MPEVNDKLCRAGDWAIYMALPRGPGEGVDEGVDEAVDWAVRDAVREEVEGA